MAEEETHPDTDGLTVHGGTAACRHQWEELPDECDDSGKIIVPARDVCVSCGGVKW